MLQSTPICRIECELAHILEFGMTPYGQRRVIDILGGTVSGHRLNGRILRGGADWQIIRGDGAAHVEARYTIETDTGALVLVSSDGVRHGPAEVLAAIARGDDVDPAAYYFRTAMRFETADAPLSWLNRVVAIARGARRKNAVELDVYEIL